MHIKAPVYEKIVLGSLPVSTFTAPDGFLYLMIEGTGKTVRLILLLHKSGK